MMTIDKLCRKHKHLSTETGVNITTFFFATYNWQLGETPYTSEGQPFVYCEFLSNEKYCNPRTLPSFALSAKKNVDYEKFWIEAII